MQLAEEYKSQVETAFCKSSGHQESWELRVIISLLVLLFLMPFMMYNIWSFSKKIQLFPLKARAPRLALIQMIYFVLLNLVPLCVEGLVALDIHWEKPDKKYLSRSFLKAIYFLIRSSVMLIYVQRTLLIYANWKVPMDQLYNLFWRVFGNENRSITVCGNHPGIHFDPDLLFSHIHDQFRQNRNGIQQLGHLRACGPRLVHALESYVCRDP
jgi:hypothetical protein